MLLAKAGWRVKKHMSAASRVASTVDRNSSLPCGEPRNTAYLVTTLEADGEKNISKVFMFGLHLNRRSRLSVRNGVPFCKQLKRPMTYYASAVWRLLPRETSGSFNTCNPSVRIEINTSWYIGNWQINEYLRIPFLSRRIRSLTGCSTQSSLKRGSP